MGPEFEARRSKYLILSHAKKAPIHNLRCVHFCQASKILTSDTTKKQSLNVMAGKMKIDDITITIFVEMETKKFS